MLLATATAGGTHSVPALFAEAFERVAALSEPTPVLDDQQQQQHLRRGSTLGEFDLKSPNGTEGGPEGDTAESASQHHAVIALRKLDAALGATSAVTRLPLLAKVLEQHRNSFSQLVHICERKAAAAAAAATATGPDDMMNDELNELMASGGDDEQDYLCKSLSLTCTWSLEFMGAILVARDLESKSDNEICAVLKSIADSVLYTLRPVVDIMSGRSHYKPAHLQVMKVSSKAITTFSLLMRRTFALVVRSSNSSVYGSLWNRLYDASLTLTNSQHLSKLERGVAVRVIQLLAALTVLYSTDTTHSAASASILASGPNQNQPPADGIHGGPPHAPSVFAEVRVSDLRDNSPSFISAARLIEAGNGYCSSIYSMLLEGTLTADTCTAVINALIHIIRSAPSQHRVVLLEVIKMWYQSGATGNIAQPLWRRSIEITLRTQLLSIAKYDQAAEGDFVRLLEDIGGQFEVQALLTYRERMLQQSMGRKRRIVYEFAPVSSAAAAASSRGSTPPPVSARPLRAQDFTPSQRVDEVLKALGKVSQDELRVLLRTGQLPPRLANRTAGRQAEADLDDDEDEVVSAAKAGLTTSQDAFIPDEMQARKRVRLGGLAHRVATASDGTTSVERSSGAVIKKKNLTSVASAAASRELTAEDRGRMLNALTGRVLAAGSNFQGRNGALLATFASTNGHAVPPSSSSNGVPVLPTLLSGNGSGNGGGGSENSADNQANSAVVFVPRTVKEVRADWATICARLIQRLSLANLDSSDSSADGGIASSSILKQLMGGITADPLAVFDVVLAWLHESYATAVRLDTDAFTKEANSADRLANGDGQSPSSSSLRLGIIVDQYSSGLLTMLASLVVRQAADRDRLLSRFLLDVPYLPPRAIDALSGQSVSLSSEGIVTVSIEDRARTMRSVPLLSTLIEQRPPVRSQCLDILLRAACDSVVPLRAAAIQALLKWIPDHPTISSVILTHANTLLEALANQFTDESAKNSATAYLEFVTAICTRVPAKVADVLNLYSQSPAWLQSVIAQLMRSAVSKIGMDSPALLSALRSFPAGSDKLALSLMVTLVNDASRRPTPALVEVARHAYSELTDNDINFLIPVMAELPRNEIIMQLPRLVDMLDQPDGPKMDDILREVFKRICTASASITGSSSSSSSVIADTSLQASGRAKLTPTELLCALHLMDSAVASAGSRKPIATPANKFLNKAAKAIDLCLQSSDIFSSEVVATALQRLVEGNSALSTANIARFQQSQQQQQQQQQSVSTTQPALPTLLMRTVIRAIDIFQRNLISFVTNLLGKLVAKQIWNMTKVLWSGFIFCCIKTIELCNTSSASSSNVSLGWLASLISVTMQLPWTQLVELAQREPNLYIAAVETALPRLPAGAQRDGAAAKLAQLRVELNIPPAVVAEADENGENGVSAASDVNSGVSVSVAVASQ